MMNNVTHCIDDIVIDNDYYYHLVTYLTRGKKYNVMK